MNFYEDEYTLIYFDAELKAVVSEEKGIYREGEKFRKHMNKMCEAVFKYKAKKLLSNTLKLKIVAQADQEWIAKVWLPHISGLGLKYNAFIIPESRITLLGVKRVDPVIEICGVKRRYCATVEEGKEWLRSITES